MALLGSCTVAKRRGPSTGPAWLAGMRGVIISHSPECQGGEDPRGGRQAARNDPDADFQQSIFTGIASFDPHSKPLRVTGQE